MGNERENNTGRSVGEKTKLSKRSNVTSTARGRTEAKQEYFAKVFPSQIGVVGGLGVGETKVEE